MTVAETALVALFGLSVGSFANVCIHRLPLGLSVVFPRSRCSRCGMAVAAYDNLPILSYVALRGRCRCCGVPFGLRYPLVEALVAVVAVAVYLRLGAGFVGVYAFAFSVSMVVAGAVDLEHRIIPDVTSVPWLFLGLAVAAASTWLRFDWPVTFYEALLGAGAGGGVLFGVGRIYEAITGREGLGFGDVKLLAAFGANVGIPGVITSVFVGSLLGSAVGLYLILFHGKGRRFAIPFGPFLIAGLLVHYLARTP